MHWGEQELAKIIPLAVHWGYWGVAASLFMEGLSIPFPGGSFLLFYGYLASQGKMSLLLAILSATTGYTIAGTIPYLIGKIGGRPLIINYGSYIGLSPKIFNTAERFFNKFGKHVVALGRLMFFRNYISYLAGITKMAPTSFYFFTWIGILPWVIYMTVMGYLLGNNWYKALELIEEYRLLGGAIIILLLVCAYYLLKTSLLNRFRLWLGDN